MKHRITKNYTGYRNPFGSFKDQFKFSIIITTIGIITVMIIECNDNSNSVNSMLSYPNSLLGTYYFQSGKTGTYIKLNLKSGGEFKIIEMGYQNMPLIELEHSYVYGAVFPGGIKSDIQVIQDSDNGDHILVVSFKNIGFNNDSLKYESAYIYAGDNLVESIYNGCVSKVK